MKIFNGKLRKLDVRGAKVIESFQTFHSANSLPRTRLVFVFSTGNITLARKKLKRTSFKKFVLD